MNINKKENEILINKSNSDIENKKNETKINIENILKEEIKDLLFLSFETDKNPVVIYKDNTLLFFNKAYQNLIEYTLEEVKNDKDIIKLLYGWDIKEENKVRLDVKNALESGKGYNCNIYTLESKSGLKHTIAWQNEIINGYQLRKGSISLAEIIKIMSDNGDTVKSIMTEFMKSVDEYTSGHINRVRELSIIIGKNFGYNKENIEKIETMALCHDIGKINIDKKILQKPDRLTEEERKIIDSHVKEGIKLGLNYGDNIYGMPHHAFFYKKSGKNDLYFDKVIDNIRSDLYYILPNFSDFVGKNIPEQARLISIADTIDAIVSRRLYNINLRDAHIETIISFLEEQLLDGAGFIIEENDIKLNLINKWKKTNEEKEKMLSYCILWENEFYIPKNEDVKIQFDPNILKTIFFEGHLKSNVKNIIIKNDKQVILFLIKEINKYLANLSINDNLSDIEKEKIIQFEISQEKLKILLDNYN